MKANELRVGNYVKVEHDWEIITSVNQHKAGCQLNKQSESIEQEYKYIHPIPLTEEWLLRFGFDKNEYKLGEYPFWEAGDFELLYDEEKEEFFYVHSYEGDKDTPINHVHSLQNLYWCLCGKELELKNRKDD